MSDFPQKLLRMQITLLENTPAQTESLLHSLEHAARVIGFYVTSDETEFMCFKKKIVPSPHQIASENPERSTLQNSGCTVIYISYRKLSEKDEHDILDPAREVKIMVRFGWFGLVFMAYQTLWII